MAFRNLKIALMILSSDFDGVSAVMAVAAEMTAVMAISHAGNEVRNSCMVFS